MHRSTSIGHSIRLMIVAALAGLTMTGCVGYTVYPPVEGVKAFADPNSNDSRLVMQSALKWASTAYPPGTINEPILDADFAINLPVGVRQSMYDIIAHQAGPKAYPLSSETEDLPIYHVARIWIRGDTADVDLLRPISDWGTDNPVHQGVSVRLRGGFQKWRVSSHRLWTLRAMEVPQLNYAYGVPSEPPPETIERISPSEVYEPMDVPAEPFEVTFPESANDSVFTGTVTEIDAGDVPIQEGTGTTDAPAPAAPRDASGDSGVYEIPVDDG